MTRYSGGRPSAERADRRKDSGKVRITVYPPGEHPKDLNATHRFWDHHGSKIYQRFTERRRKKKAGGRLRGQSSWDRKAPNYYKFALRDGSMVLHESDDFEQILRTRIRTEMSQ